MSVFGVSSYFLWTQKGATVLPLVRGSGFTIAFDIKSAFHKLHVITAAHVACPVKYAPIYGGSDGLKAIGERHITTGLLLQATPRQPNTKVVPVPLAFVQKRFLGLDVASLRMKKEDALLADEGMRQRVVPLSVDLNPISEGERLEFCGMRAIEEPANPNDDGLRMTEEVFEGECHSALQSLDYGTVLLAKSDVLPHASMCGGPVLRKGTNQCVGVIVAPVRHAAPPSLARTLHRRRDEEEDADAPPSPLPKDMEKLIREPWLDISATTQLADVAPQLKVAFVPIREFYKQLRGCEI